MRFSKMTYRLTLIAFLICFVSCKTETDVVNSSNALEATGGVSNVKRISTLQLLSIVAGDKLDSDLGQRFEAWFDSGQDSTKLPQPLGDLLLVSNYQNAADCPLTDPLTIAKNKNGNVVAIVGGGNIGQEGHDSLLVVQDGISFWMTLSQVQELISGRCCSFAARNLENSAKYWVTSDLIDLGIIRNNRSEKDCFIVNQSPFPITVTDRKFTCDCANLRFSNNTIPPLGVVKATFYVNTTGRKDGDLDVKALLTTNPKSTPVLFKLAGSISTPTKLEPSVLSVGNITANSEKITLRFVAMFEEQLGGDVFPCFLPDGVTWLKTEIDNADTRRVNCYLTVDPTLIAVGEFELSCAIGLRAKQTANQAEAAQALVFAIPIMGRKLPLIRFSPPEVYVGKCRPGAKLTRQVKVFNDTVHAIKAFAEDSELVRPTVGDGNLEFSIQVPSAGGHFSSLVFLRAGTAYSVVGVSGYVDVPEDQTTLVESAKTELEGQPMPNQKTSSH